jgi:hypothetical protein
MNAKQKFHQAHLAEWTARFSDQRASGLTVRQWCDQNHVSIHKYNYWKHQLKEEVVDQMLPDIVPLPVPAPLSAPDHTIPQDSQSAQIVHDRPVRANCGNRTNRANVKFCVDGVSLEVEPSINEDFLRVLIRAVHYA